MFGVPSQFSTGRYEALHAMMKAWRRITNNLIVFYDTSVRASLQHTMEVSLSSYTELMADIVENVKPGRKTKQRALPLTDSNQVLCFRALARDLTADELAALLTSIPGVDINDIKSVTFYQNLKLPSSATLRKGDSFRYEKNGDDQHFAHVNVFAGITFNPNNTPPLFVCFANPYHPLNTVRRLNGDLQLHQVVFLPLPTDQIAIKTGQIHREESILEDFDIPLQFYVNYYFRSTSRFHSHAKAAGR
jgi:hypothetical protein